MTDPVQQQVEAFNDRDLDSFMDAYAPDARVEDGVGDWTVDEERVEGLEAEGFPEQAHAAVAYRVTDGKITLVRMFM